MKKRLAVLLVMLVACGNCVAFANDVQSLDDVINGTTNVVQQVEYPAEVAVTQPNQNQSAVNQNQTQTQVQTGQIQNNTNNKIEQVTQNVEGYTQQIDKTLSNIPKKETGFFSSLMEHADMSEYENETVKEAGASLSRFVAMVVQFLSYVIVAGMTLRVGLDLCFVTLPFMRNILTGGAYKGNNGTNTNTNIGYQQNSYQQGGWQNNNNGGWQNNNNGGFIGNNTQNRTGGMSFDLVSETAVMAVQNGGNVPGAFKIYMKDMAALMILTPILLVLAISGALTAIGFAVGQMIAGVIGSFSFIG